MGSVQTDLSTKDIIEAIRRATRSEDATDNREFITQLALVTMELYLEASLVLPREDVEEAYARMKDVLDGHFSPKTKEPT